MMGDSVDNVAEAQKAAAAWIERLTSGEATTPAELANLRAWLHADPVHRTAYEQARALWVELDRTELVHPARNRARSLAGLAVAASFALACWLVWPTPDFINSVGQSRKLQLADGTRVWLDSSSAIDVHIDNDARTVRLIRGRAAFDVAKDARPFSVTAGGARIQDIGTTFSVDRLNGLSVEVDRGAVDVAEDGRHTTLGAGNGAAFTTDKVLRHVVTADTFAWREHRLVLDNVRLDEALAALDRYFPGRILLRSKEIAANRVSGTLRVDQPEVALQTLLRSQHLQATRLPWIVLISSDHR